MDIYESFMDALQKAVDKAGNLHRFADNTGLNYSTLYRWLSRKQVPSLDGLKPVLPYIHWPEMVPDKKTTMRRIGVNAPVESVEGENLPTIPVFLQAGAGNPVEFWNTEPERHIEILPRYFRSNVRAVEVIGDSMEPTIKQGAIVGVVPVAGGLAEGRIYLVNRPPFGLVVKRVRSNRNGEIVLYSDNPQYEPQPIPYEGYDDMIIGQIIWVWQEI